MTRGICSMLVLTITLACFLSLCIGGKKSSHGHSYGKEEEHFSLATHGQVHGSGTVHMATKYVVSVEDCALWCMITKGCWRLTSENTACTGAAYRCVMEYSPEAGDMFADQAGSASRAALYQKSGNHRNRAGNGSSENGGKLSTSIDAALYHVTLNKYLLFYGCHVIMYNSTEDIETGSHSDPISVTDIYPGFPGPRVGAIMAQPTEHWYNQMLFHEGQRYLSVYKNTKDEGLFEPPTLFDQILDFKDFDLDLDVTTAFHIQQCFPDVSACNGTVKYKVYFLSHDVMQEVWMTTAPDSEYFGQYSSVARYSRDNCTEFPGFPEGVTAATQVDDGAKVIFFTGWNYTIFDVESKTYTPSTELPVAFRSQEGQ